MNPNEYQKLALRTAPDDILSNTKECLQNSALGICGEAGEFADIIKKVYFQNHTIDNEHLAKELGDVLWYIALGANAIGYSIEDIMMMNIEKLKKRYPNGFDPNLSMHRVAGDI